MPDLSLDPSALTVTSLPPPSSVPTKSNAASALAAAKAAKAASSAPRIDLEPLYTSLKTSIGEYWAEYKAAIGGLVLGTLSQREFCLRTDHFLAGDSLVEHQHNQLIAGIYINGGRDPPEPGVAPWVSANDKPIVTSKPTAGDAVEQRLKTEIKQLPARDRRRMKDVPEPEVADPISAHILEYQLAKKFRSGDYVPPSVGGKTNWELEIKKRFAPPLAAESGEFPDAEVIQARMVPICYSESLSNGAAAPCAGFMATAAEQFIKELLSSIYSKTRTNMPGGSVNSVQTHRFKSQLQLEEDQLSRHEIHKVPGTGLLPVEAKEASTRPGLAIHDLKVALDIGDISFGQFPVVSSKIKNSYSEGEYEEYLARRADNVAAIKERQRKETERAQKVKALDQDVEMTGTEQPNGASSASGFGTDGIHGGSSFMDDDEEEDEDDDDDWGWEGGNVESRSQLNASLDQCLAIEA